VRRAQLADERQHDRELRREQREREHRREAARDRAEAQAYAQAILRGEDVSPLDMAGGNLGRTWEEITGGPAAAVADRIPREHREPVNYLGDWGAPALAVGEAPAQRSRCADASAQHLPPGFGLYGLDRQIAEAEALHRDLITYQARRSGVTFGEAMAARSREASRYDNPCGPGEGAYGEIVR
jgi:hypothetical protein